MSNRVRVGIPGQVFRGPRGLKGEKGDSFEPDALGLASQRSNYATREEKFSFLDTENGLLYFKLSAASGNWSLGIPFGRGEDGDDGLSAYEVWLASGNVGSEEDFINALVGGTGLSAYEIWLSEGNTGTVEAFFEALRGPEGEGEPGQSAYQIALSNGFDGTEEEFLASLRGDVGPSAYEAWLEAGNTGDPEDFFATLEGKSAYAVWLDAGNTGDPSDFFESLTGPAGQGETGDPGDSAYQVWLDAGNSGSEEDFLESLRGDPGYGFSADAVGLLTDRDEWDLQPPPFSYFATDTELVYFKRSATDGDWTNGTSFRGVAGVAGPSAYEVWLSAGNVGTEADFFNAIRGQRGQAGPGLVSGGSPGQVPVRVGSTEFQTEWRTILASLEETREWGDGAKGITPAGLAQLVAPTRKAALCLGGTSGGIGTTTEYTSFSTRNVIKLGVKTKRYRIKIRNISLTAQATVNAAEVPHTGAIAINSGYIGKQALTTDGEWTPNFDGAQSQILASASTPQDGSEWVSPWIDDPAKQLEAGINYILALGFTAAAGQAISQGSNKVYVNPSSGTTVVSQSAPTGYTLKQPQPLSIIIEYEFRGTNPVGIFFGDSITEGTGTAQGQFDSYANRWAAINEGCAMKCSIGGSRVADFVGEGYRYDKIMSDGAYIPADFGVISYGTNDIGFGRTESQIKTNLQTLIRKVRSKYLAKKVYLGLIAPRNTFDSTQNALAATINSWMCELPSGVEGVLVFDKQLEAASPATNLRARYDSSDGVHPNTSGHQAMLAALPFAGSRSVLL